MITTIIILSVLLLASAFVNINQLRKQEDIEIVNYHYTETPITKDTDIKYFDVTIN